MLEVEKFSKVSFGTAQDRQIFPTHVPPTRFGNELNPISGSPDIGPGRYNNDVTNFIHQFNVRPMSKKGYILAARLAPRFHDYIDMVTPAPTEYQVNSCEPRTFSPAYRPFNVSAGRFHVSKSVLNDVTPGPGTYEQDLKKCRRVQYHQSFGGEPINLPNIKQHSTIDRNTDKLRTTKEEKRYHRKLAYLKLYYE